MKRKWQRILSWVLTLTMLFSTFQTTGLAAYAEDGEEEIVAETPDDPEVDEPELDGDGVANAVYTVAGPESVVANVDQAIDEFVVTATMGTGTADGAAVTWKLYKVEGTTETETTLPDGLTATTVATASGKAYYKITGTPTKAMAATKYKIGAKGTAGDEVKTSEITVTITGVTLTVDNGALNTASFTKAGAGAVTMGYTVADKVEDTDTFATNVYTKVAPKKVVIKNDSAVSTISDLKFSVNADHAYFTVSPATATLAPKASVELTITPVEGLECKGSDATYNSNLVIESEKLAGGKKTDLVTMGIVVTSDLSATVVKDGTEVKAEANGSYKLVTVKVGETLSQNITISTKGSKDPEWLDGEEVAIETTGLKATRSADKKTYTLSGTVAAVAAGPYNFTLNSKDSLGNTKEFTNAFIVTVEEAEVIYTIGGDSLGDSLAWEAVKPEEAPSVSDINAASKEITVTNNSGSAVTLTPALTTGAAFEISGQITVQPGQNGKVTIMPKSATLANANSYSDTLTITGAGVKTKTVEIQLDVLGNTDTLNIQGNSAEVLTGEVGVNKSYNFKLNKADDTGAWDFINDGDDVLKAAGLSIKKNAGGSATISGVPSKKTTGDVTFTVYYFVDEDADGVYDVGEEVKASKSFKINIKASSTAVEAKNGEDILTGIKDEDKLKTTIKTLDLGEYNTDYDAAKVKTLSGNVALTNKLPLVLGDTTLAVAGGFMKYNAKDSKYETVTAAITVGAHETATDAKLFTVVKADGTALNTVNLTRGAVDEESGKAEFWVIPNEAVLKYLPANKYRQAITITPADSDNVGTYTIYVDIEVKTAPVVAAITTWKTVAENGTLTALVSEQTYTRSDLGGSKIKAGVAIPTISLNAVSQNGAELTGVTWTMSKQKDADYDIATSGLTLSPAGILTGTPTVAGTYPVTFTVTETATGLSGHLDTNVVVGASATATLISDDYDYPVDGVYTFAGTAVKGGSQTLTLTIKNTSVVAINHLKVTTKNATFGQIVGATGDYKDKVISENSVSHITASIKNSVTSLAATGTEGDSALIEVSTVNPEKLDTYAVIVTIDADEIAPISFPVVWAVEKKLEIKTPSASDLTFEVGQTKDVVLAPVETVSHNKITTTGISTVNDPVVWKQVDAAKTDVTLETNPLKDSGITFNTGAHKFSGIPVKAGTYTVSVNATIAADDDGVVKIAAQDTNVVTYTITVNKSASVNVTSVAGSNDSLVQGKSTAKDNTKASSKTNPVTKYTFATQPVGYNKTDKTLEMAELSAVIDTKAAVSLEVSANFASADSKFELVASFDADKAKTKTANVSQTDGVLFKIQPKTGLAAGTYTDTLTISGKQIETVSVELEFVVEAANYEFTASQNKVLLDANKGIVLAPIKQGAAFDSSNTANIVQIMNTGNIKATITSIEEVDANGNKLGSGATNRLLKNPTFNPSTLVPNYNGVAQDASATFVANSYATFAVEPNSAKLNTPGVYETYVGIFYDDKSIQGKVAYFPVKYVVYKSNITDATITPNSEPTADGALALNTASVKEGYTTAFSKALTLTNGAAATTATEADSLYYVEASISHVWDVNGSVVAGIKGAFDGATAAAGSSNANDIAKYFTLNGAKLDDTKFGIKALAKGASEVFTVSANKGLPVGTYYAQIKFSAADAAKSNLTATQYSYVKFTVAEAGTDFATDVKDVDVNVESAAYAQRLFRTLNGMTGSGKVAFDGNLETGKVYIKLDTDDTNDVTVTFKKTAGDYHIGIDEVSAIASATIQRHDDRKVTSDSYTLDTSAATGEGSKYAKLSFTFYDAVTWAHNATFVDLGEGVGRFTEVGDGGFYKDGKIKNETDTTYVKHGKQLSDAISAFPTVSRNGASVRFWADQSATATKTKGMEITLNTKITEDITVGPTWGTHEYPASTSENIPGKVEWKWTGDDEKGYTAEVTVYCIDTNCPDVDHAKQTIKATVVETSEKATCTKGTRKTWKATATYSGATYTNVKEAAAQTPALGHIWKFDTDEKNVQWIGNDKDGYTAAIITKTCESASHNAIHDGDVKVSVSVNVTVSDNGAKCGEVGTTYYTATFDSTVDPAIKEAFKFQKVVTGEIVKHVWKVTKVESNGSYETAPTEAKMTIVCEKDASETQTVSASSITMVSSNETQKTYKYVGSASDNQVVEAEETFYSHTEHVWDVKFTWVSVSTNKADTDVTAEATCKNGGEKVELPVTLEDKTVGSKIQYTAIATDGNGKVWKETKNIDTKNGDIKDGPAGTPTVEGGDIVIIGVEETYAFTGSKIKPAITVMDGDIVLAQSTDYTVSYKGKNKVNEINTVEVKGKGNYAGKSATAKFTIVDSRADIDPEELAGAIKKVSVSEKNFTYNGKAQYPATVTVELKDKTKIVYTVDEDGSFDTDSDKKVGLSFSNNINKGTATVAAMGSDGKVKKASYKIAAADISTATFVVDEATWAVKPEAAKVTATFGDDEMELVAGQDFKVTYTAKAAGDAAGSAKISGKGNFKGKLSAPVSYKVNALELEEKNIIVSAVAGKKISNVKVQVVDNAGNALGKKLYTVAFFNGETELGKKDAVPEDLTVVVKASGNATTGEDGISVTVNPKADIAKVKGAFKVDKNFSKTYTGEAIELDAEDFVAGKIDPKGLEYGTDFEVVSYKNNVKKGSMTVTVEGKGEYSGTKTFKVKISAKPIDKAVTED